MTCFDDSVHARYTNLQVLGDLPLNMARCQQYVDACGHYPCSGLRSLVSALVKRQGLVGHFCGFDPYTLAYQHLIPLELSNTSEDVQHQGGGRGVDIHIQYANRWADYCEGFGDADHVRDVACSTVNFGDGDDVASLQALHERCPLSTRFHVGGAHLLREYAVTGALVQLGDWSSRAYCWSNIDVSAYPYFISMLLFIIKLWSL